MKLTTDQEQLEILNEKRAAVMDAMAKISARFVAQVAEELPDRWEKIVRHFIIERPEVALAQGSEGLSRLKTELHRLQTSARDLACKHLSGPKVWRHQQVQADEKRDNYQAEDSSVSVRTHPWRRSRITGPLSRAEAEVLYLLRPVFGSRSGPWLDSAKGKLSEPLEHMLDAYEQLGGQLEEIDTERCALMRRISREEAERLWDSA